MRDGTDCGCDDTGCTYCGARMRRNREAALLTEAARTAPINPDSVYELLDTVGKAWRDVATLRAEVARLRAALAEINGLEPSGIIGTSVAQCKRIARAALDGAR